MFFFFSFFGKEDGKNVLWRKAVVTARLPYRNICDTSTYASLSADAQVASIGDNLSADRRGYQRRHPDRYRGARNDRGVCPLLYRYRGYIRGKGMASFYSLQHQMALVSFVVRRRYHFLRAHAKGMVLSVHSLALFLVANDARHIERARPRSFAGRFPVSTSAMSINCIRAHPKSPGSAPCCFPLSFS